MGGRQHLGEALGGQSTHRFAATNPPQKWLENVAKVWTTPVDQLGRALITLLVASWADDEIGPTLRAILQTAAHEPSTREKLRFAAASFRRR